MSRHRAVRNLDLDDEMAEDDFDSRAEDPYESITAEERAALDEAMTTLTSVLGPSPQNGFTEREMQDQLWEAYFDVDQATSALIEERSRREARDKKRAGESHLQTTGRQHLFCLFGLAVLGDTSTSSREEVLACPLAGQTRGVRRCWLLS